MSGGHIDILLDLWAATLYQHQDKPPFANHHDLYETIAQTCIGDVSWQNFSVKYTGMIPDTNPPPWMLSEQEVWFCDLRHVVDKILGNPSFTNEIDLRLFHEYSVDGDVHQYQDFMSADWAWNQAVSPTYNSFFIPQAYETYRTTSPMICLLMAAHLCPSSWEATRPQYQLLLVTMNSTLCTYPSGTCTITFSERIVTHWSLLHSCRFQRVSAIGNTIPMVQEHKGMSV